MSAVRVLCCVLLWGVSISSGAAPGAHGPAAEACIDEHSGADSGDCLRHIYAASLADLQRARAAFAAALRDRLQRDDITATHYSSSRASIRKAHAAFATYREQYCLSVTYASGAVASGFMQWRYTCMIELNDAEYWRVRQAQRTMERLQE